MEGMRERIEWAVEDEQSLIRTFPLRFSPSARRRLTAFYESHLSDLQGAEAGSPDRALFDWSLKKRLNEERRRASAEAELWKALPCSYAVFEILDRQRQLDFLAGSEAAVLLSQIPKVEPEPLADPVLNGLAVPAIERMKGALEKWHDFHAPYDPAFSWWVSKPYEQAIRALDRISDACKAAETSIPGQPIGDEALQKELDLDLIPYSPDQLIERAERERKWCSEQMLQAARELGCSSISEGLEEVKDQCLDPGQQPAMVRDMAREAALLVEEKDLLTVPPIAAETWRMEMMTTEAQKANPFFLGGETIYVSYPTEEMDHAWKAMAMRGNCPGFSRATVQHELIPGHHMQMYFMSRCHPHRRFYETPFWIEGWTIHWEMLLWELGFPRTPEERIGMMFWRRHRACRVVFSLRFHQGKMSTQDCVDYLVEEAGHERSTAEGEVRRSFRGDYDPLYQLAYLIGGYQVHRLHAEMLAAGWSQRQFHDRFLRENIMPIPALRRIMKGQDFPAELTPDWSFLDAD